MCFPASLLLLPRELPSYLRVAYSLRYAGEPPEGNQFTRVYHTTKKVFSLIKEILFYRPSFIDFQENREKLQKDFKEITSTLTRNTKPICIYFVSANDHNGAILGNHLYYYHHYKIQNLQKYFSVAPKLVSSQDEMKAFMREIKELYPEKEIQFVDIVSHGSKSGLLIHPQYRKLLTPDELRDDLFEDVSLKGTILLDACITGLGDRNIADEIARKTPGRTILAPGPSMFFSKPVVQIKNHLPKVVSAVHGFAIFRAYTCKVFSYQEKKPSRYPYVKDESFQPDILRIVSFPRLQNSWLDSLVHEETEADRERVIGLFDRLSPATRALITHQIWENNGSPSDDKDTFGETFFRKNPLHATVRSAFRTVFYELIHEVRDYPAVSRAKILLCTYNVFQVIGAWFHNLRA